MRKLAITISLIGGAFFALRYVVPLLPDPRATVMAGSAALALGLLAPALKRARAEGDLDSSTVLTLALGWLVSLPIAAAVFTGGVERRPNPAGELVPVLPGWYEQAAHVSLALLMALAAALLVRRLVLDGRRVTLHTAGLLAIVLWTVAWLASGLQGGRLLSLSGATLLVCLMAATALPRGRGACTGVAVFGVTLAAASGLLAAFQPDLALVPCQGACVLDSSLTGALPNENLLGTTLLAALPFAYLGFRGRSRDWLVAYLAGMAIATGSRGAMLGAVVLLAALLVVRPRLDADRPTRARTAIAGLLLLVAVIPSMYVVGHHWRSSTYQLDDRPALWRVASDYTADSPLLGYGPDRWERLYTDAGEIPFTAQHSTHNQLVDVLFNAGWVGVGLLLAVVIAMVWSAGYARAAVLITLATVFIIGIAERAWSVGAVDFVSFSLVALILLGPTGTGARRADANEDRARPPLRSVAVPSG